MSESNELISLAQRFADHVRGAATAVVRGVAGVQPEGQFRTQVEAFLPEVFAHWNIDFQPSNERATITGRRIDMLCGRLVTEYKAPGVLDSDPGYKAAVEQARDYLEQLAVEFGEPVTEYYGIVLDGFHVGFVHRDSEQGWLVSERREMNEQSAVEVLERFRGHAKHPLDAGKIAESLGPASTPARALMPALVRALEEPGGKTALLFAEWRRLFGQSVGTEAHQYPGVVDWAASIGVQICGQDEEQLARLFFATHSYFALVTKVLTADIVGTIRSRSLFQFAGALAGTDIAGRLELLRELESNALFERFGIIGFLEGDFFSWYLEHYDERIDEGVALLATAASSFEPATPLLSPSRVTDLFKKLYQNLVPERIRHDLGEFYTPDWLADYVLERSGFAYEPTKRLLDPTCGSGTFLVRAIRYLKRYLKDQQDVPCGWLLRHVQEKNLAGFDLNPLAVIAARANFVVALLDELAEFDEPVRVPIYLADSIYAPEEEGDEYVYRLSPDRGTVVMRFPRLLVQSADFDAVLREVERFMWEDGDKPAPQDLPPDSLVVRSGLCSFYEQIWELDEQDWNKIWCRIINNRFASVQVGKFDYVVGNPPWVVWSNLPASYRQAVKPVCDRYNIFSDDAWVGGIESDISTIVTYVATDRWLRTGGVLGFVITQSVFKTKSAQGFRGFRLPSGERLKVFHVDDMVAIRPFDDAANRTATIFLRKGQATVHPVPYVVWKRRSRRHRFSTADSLPMVLRQVHVWANDAAPVDGRSGSWITAPSGHLPTLLALLRGVGIHARKGTTTDFNNIYWVRVEAVAGDIARVTNSLSTLGHQLEQQTFEVEEALVFPLARGQDIRRFRVASPQTAIILPQRGMRSYDYAKMAADFPRALGYFAQYEVSACRGCRVGRSCGRGLRDRASYSNPKYHNAMGDYWGVWNVGEYTFSPYKVAWKEVSSTFEAAVLSTSEIGGMKRKLHIPDHKLMFKPCDSEFEAHYYCGALNSELIRTFAEAVSLSTSRGARIFESLNIPVFDVSAPAHMRVAELSMMAHADRLLDDEFEAELNSAVAEALGHSVGMGLEMLDAHEWEEPLLGGLRSGLEVRAGVDFPGSATRLAATTFVAFDFETTGFNAARFGERVVEIGAVKFDFGGIRESWHSLVWPGRPVSPAAQRVHGIGLDDLNGELPFRGIWSEFREFLGDAVLVAHNAPFDLSFLAAHLDDLGEVFDGVVIDTLDLLRSQFSLPSNRLAEAAGALGVEGEATHEALADATATAQLFLRICEILQTRGEVVTLADLGSLQQADPLFSFSAFRPRDTFDALVGTGVIAAYSRNGLEVSRIHGKLVDRCCSEERSYFTIELANGKRLVLRGDRLLEIQRA